MNVRIDPWLELIDVEQFGIPGRGAAYLVQGEELALIETGTARSAPILRDALRGIKLAFVFVTHVHLDHAGGAGYIAADHPEATIVASPRAIPHLIDPTRLIKGVRMASPELFPLYGEPIPIPEERLHPASDSELFDLGKIEIEAVASPGHAPHHISFFERSHRYLFTGDALGNYGVPADLPLTVPPRFDIEKGLATIERFKSLRPERLAFTHFGLSEGDPLRIIADHEKRLILWFERIERDLSAGMSEEEIVGRILSEPEYRGLSRIDRASVAMCVRGAIATLEGR